MEVRGHLLQQVILPCPPPLATTHCVLLIAHAAPAHHRSHPSLVHFPFCSLQVLTNITHRGAVYDSLADRGLDCIPHSHTHSCNPVSPAATPDEVEHHEGRIASLLQAAEQKGTEPQGAVIRSFFTTDANEQRDAALMAQCAVNELGVGCIVFSQLSELDHKVGLAIGAFEAQQQGVQVAQKISNWLPISTPWCVPSSTHATDAQTHAHIA
jgi:hypothetical protein